MMEKATLLLLCCLVMSLSGSPLYPTIRFGQRDTSILMTSSMNDGAEQEDHIHPAREQAELRSGRHADAIFTNSYRKVLGQISARKFLQTIMGKRLGDESESYMKQHSKIHEDLTSVLRNWEYRAVNGNIVKSGLLS
uniref:Somatoliberin n=1 Tax=Gouania willdenowi TaxID=441366 RepID=A0A8C5GX20_GOUWI